MDVEVIQFIIPTSNRKNLFVTNIHTLDKDQIYVTLYDSFSPHGLLYEVQIFPYSGAAGVPDGDTSRHPSRHRGCYAFVKFYSYRSAVSAKTSLDGKLRIGDSVCKVAFANRRNTDKLVTTLQLDRCYELGAYYLGFNGWSTKITKMEEDKDCPQPEDVNLRTVRFVCCVRLDLTKQSLSCTGVGVWEETVAKKDSTLLASALAKVRKLAHKRAIEDAFPKLVVISLSSGKTYVEVNTTLAEQVLAAHHVDDSELLPVNEIEAVPGDQDDGTVNIDDVNLQLLQELEDT